MHIVIANNIRQGKAFSDKFSGFAGLTHLRSNLVQFFDGTGYRIVTHENDVRGLSANHADMIILLDGYDPAVLAYAKECWAYIGQPPIVCLYDRDKDPNVEKKNGYYEHKPREV
jgi:hypothetical protein